MWRRSLQPEALNLVRVLPIDNAAWISARVAPLPNLSTSSRYWVELRDDVLILYPALQLLHHYKRIYDAPPQHYPFTLRPVTSVRHLEALPFPQIASVAELVPSASALAFVLPSVRLTCRPANLAVHLKAHPIRPAARIFFDSPSALSQWSEHLVRAVSRDRKRLSDFRIVRHVGKGASGRVYLVEDKLTAQRYALKVIEKTTVFESRDTYRHAMDERLVLQMIRHHPYILDMYYAFQNSKRLFIVTEYCSGGDLFEYMNQRVAPLDESTARFVSAQVLLALSHLHQLGIVYRDLKLENILIDSNGNVRLADFGLTKVLRNRQGHLTRTNTFCGTREYVAPEMLRGDPYDTSLDFWTFGILLYEMLSGRTPFYTSDHSEIYKRIEKSSVAYPRNLSYEVRNLISKLLVRNPEKRLGAIGEGIELLKDHPWYESIDWDALKERDGVKSPLKKSVDFLRRQEERTSAFITMGGQLMRKTRKEAKQEKAFAEVVADVEADQRIASLRVNRKEKSGGQGLSWSGSLLGNGRRRGGRVGSAVLAGYSYYDEQGYGVPESGGYGALSMASTSTMVWSRRWVKEKVKQLDMLEEVEDMEARGEGQSGTSMAKADSSEPRFKEAILEDVQGEKEMTGEESESPRCVRSTANSGEVAGGDVAGRVEKMRVSPATWASGPCEVG